MIRYVCMYQFSYRITLLYIGLYNKRKEIKNWGPLREAWMLSEITRREGEWENIFISFAFSFFYPKSRFSLGHSV